MVVDSLLVGGTVAVLLCKAVSEKFFQSVSTDVTIATVRLLMVDRYDCTNALTFL